MASDCPYCKTGSCYNTGFTVECINKKCQFFSQQHYDYVFAEQLKTQQETQLSLLESEKEFDDPMTYFGYGQYYTSFKK